MGVCPLSMILKSATRVFCLCISLLVAGYALGQVQPDAYARFLQTQDIALEVPLVQAQNVDLDRYVILDTRPKAEFEVNHIPGALRMGYSPRNPQLLEGLDKDQPVLVYCTIGWRSGKVGKWLQSQGFTQVHNLAGGIISWANAGLTLENAQAATNEVHTYGKRFAPFLTQGTAVW